MQLLALNTIIVLQIQKGKVMYTINELVTAIYEDNFSHLDFMENMGGGDCDCLIHSVLNTIAKYAGIEVGA